MSFEQPQSYETNRDKIIQRCQELDSQIQTLIETTQKLEKHGWKIRNVEWAKKSLSETQNDIKNYQRRLTEWPRGIFGVKNKKEHENLIAKIEKLQKGIGTKQQVLENAQSELSEYGEDKSFGDIEGKKRSLLEKVKQLKWERRKTGIKLFEKTGDSSLESALEMYGDLLFGPEEIQKVFDLSLKPEDIPSLPSKEKLEKVKNLKGVSVILGLKAIEGQPSEWELFPNKIISPETRFKDYVEETRGIREFLKKHDLISQEELEEATDEELDRLAELIRDDKSEAFEQLVNMRINQGRRHSVDDMIYFVRLIRSEADDSKYTRDSHSPRTSGFRRQEVLDDSYESTKSFKKDERGVWVQRIGKFTDPRGGGYLKEANKPTSNETSGFGTYYETGVRIIL